MKQRGESTSQLDRHCHVSICVEQSFGSVDFELARISGFWMLGGFFSLHDQWQQVPFVAEKEKSMNDDGSLNPPYQHQPSLGEKPTVEAQLNANHCLGLQGTLPRLTVGRDRLLGYYRALTFGTRR
jgi:hypothetical protein